MNRRAFLGAVIASACGGRASTPTPPKPDRDHAPLPTTIDPLETLIPSGPSPFAAHGEVIAQRVGTEIWRWDAIAMRRVDVLSFDGALAFTFLADGSLAVLTQAPGSCSIHLVDAQKPARTFVTSVCGPMTRRPPMLFAGAKADAIYLLDDVDLQLYRLAGFQLDPVATIAFPFAHTVQRSQAFSLDDGRIVTAGEGVDVVAANAPTRTAQTGSRTVRQIARASADRVWYTHASSTTSWGIDRLVLARLDAPPTEIATFEAAPSRIVGLGSHGSAIAVLLVTRAKHWELAIIEESGKTRWRVSLEVPAAFDLAKVAAVVMTARRVIVRGLDDKLLAWDAATGSTIDVHAP